MKSITYKDLNKAKNNFEGILVASYQEPGFHKRLLFNPMSISYIIHIRRGNTKEKPIITFNAEDAINFYNNAY